MAENWLNDETFDFDVSLSGSSVDGGALSSTDDEEVFFGPLTHKEKCMAVVVQEKEAMKRVETLNPDEQAMLLRESALINLKIKNRRAPGCQNISPLAVARPINMQSQSGMVPSVIISEENKDNNINHSTVHSLKTEIESSEIGTLVTEESKENVPVAKEDHAKLPIVSKSSSLVSMSGSSQQCTASNMDSKEMGTSTNSEQKPKSRRSSTIPKWGIAKSKSAASVPSSSMPKSQGTNTCLVKPRVGSKQGVKALSQSSIQPPVKIPAHSATGTVKPELRLSGRRSISTPSNATLASKKTAQERLPHKKALLGIDRHQSSTSKNIPQKLSDKSGLKPGDKVIPVIKSRKSIIKRKLTD